MGASRRPQDGADSVSNVLAGMAARRKQHIAAARAAGREATSRARYTRAGQGVGLSSSDGAPAAGLLPPSPARQSPGGGGSRARRRTAPALERTKWGRSAGRGKLWTGGERVALRRAVREATLNGLLAADQQKKEYWGQMLLAMAEQTL